jgi:hypothetical protein
MVGLQWDYDGNAMGIYLRWEYNGIMMGISWDYERNAMGIYL